MDALCTAGTMASAALLQLNSPPKILLIVRYLNNIDVELEFKWRTIVQ